MQPHTQVLNYHYMYNGNFPTPVHNVGHIADVCLINRFEFSFIHLQYLFTTVANTYLHTHVADYRPGKAVNLSVYGRSVAYAYD